MRERKHGTKRGRGLQRLTIVALCVLVLVTLAAGAAFAGYRYERARSDRALPGVTIAGHDIGGMTRAEAERALSGTVRSILDRSVTISAGGQTWTRTAGQLGTKVHLDRALDEAFGAADGMGWPSRLYHRLLDRPVARQVSLEVSYAGGPIGKLLDAVAADVEQAPVDAAVDFVDGQPVLRHAQPGRQLNAKAARTALTDAVRGGSATAVRLPTVKVQPQVTEDDLGETIVVRVSQNELYLYDGVTLEKSYPVATGQLDKYPTPLGHFHIINKRINPTWYNPAKDTWGADEPDFIPPGPDNPLGTRALDLDAPGIRIHGTPSDDSIGTWASHGCIRMHIPDSEDLFDRVDVGTPVIILW